MHFIVVLVLATIIFVASRFIADCVHHAIEERRVKNVIPSEFEQRGA